MEDFSCASDYGWKISCGGLDSIHGQGGEDLKLEVLDGLHDEVDEVDDIHAADDPCEDFHLDRRDCKSLLGGILRNFLEILLPERISYLKSDQKKNFLKCHLNPGLGEDIPRKLCQN